MHARGSRRWLAAIPLTGRFYILFGILLLAVAGVLFASLGATKLQAAASSDLARVAAVQRSLDRALNIHSSLSAELAASPGAGGGAQNLLTSLRTQMDLTWALPATPEVGSIIDSLRQPATNYFESAETYVQKGTAGSDWAFADLEPRRAALESSLRDSMARMRVVLFRVETRVLAEAERADSVTAWLIAGAVLAVLLAGFALWLVAHSIQNSLRSVGEVAQALAAGDMDNRCDTHGHDEVSGLAKMINLLADTMQGMLTRLRSEASRSTFSNQLVEALEMADSEAEADKVIARAMGTISEVHPMELLLADSSRAHLERACVHPKTGFAELLAWNHRTPASRCAAAIRRSSRMPKRSTPVPNCWAAWAAPYPQPACP